MATKESLEGKGTWWGISNSLVVTASSTFCSLLVELVVHLQIHHIIAWCWYAIEVEDDWHHRNVTIKEKSLQEMAHPMKISTSSCFRLQIELRQLLRVPSICTHNITFSNTHLVEFLLFKLSFVWLSNCLTVTLPWTVTCTVTLSYCHTVFLSHCPTVILSYCHTVLLLYCPTVTLSYCHTVIHM